MITSMCKQIGFSALKQHLGCSDWGQDNVNCSYSSRCSAIYYSIIYILQVACVDLLLSKSQWELVPKPIRQEENWSCWHEIFKTNGRISTLVYLSRDIFLSHHNEFRQSIICLSLQIILIISSELRYFFLFKVTTR